MAHIQRFVDNNQRMFKKDLQLLHYAHYSSDDCGLLGNWQFDHGHCLKFIRANGTSSGFLLP